MNCKSKSLQKHLLYVFLTSNRGHYSDLLLQEWKSTHLKPIEMQSVYSPFCRDQKRWSDPHQPFQTPSWAPDLSLSVCWTQENNRTQINVDSSRLKYLERIILWIIKEQQIYQAVVSTCCHRHLAMLYFFYPSLHCYMVWWKTWHKNVSRHIFHTSFQVYPHSAVNFERLIW